MLCMIIFKEGALPTSALHSNRLVRKIISQFGDNLKLLSIIDIASKGILSFVKHVYHIANDVHGSNVNMQTGNNKPEVNYLSH